ncbi:hypothetical protein [Nonlabens tegetincola]|uniref:hypothetical protein n=1 Tax=Nonlabens tegetincola TaxID=323273 RepID=UPI000CF50861|nr:hypothetical protein [Nonlabens tegetincola]PQJ19179.1 hypothetical protein BST93_05300 [Nonlabens tegetincola]
MKKLLLSSLLLLLFTAVRAQDDQDVKKAPLDFLDLFDSERREKENVRTNTNLVWAIGWNQALGDGNGIGDDYRFWGSGVFDIGLEFSTRLQPKDDLFRFNYGLDLRFQSLRITDNRQFATNNNITDLVPVGIDTDRSRFYQFSLVAPLHIEIGRRDLKTYKNGIKRYHDEDAFVVGLGGYLGYTTTSTQELKFEREGRDVTTTVTNDFEINNFNYGLSMYAGWYDFQIFARYGLNDILKDSPIQQQYFSFGFRFR